ncbi:DNA alkylation repair protein [Kribbella sp. NPDC051718]|uniref:DNA alkylation repair protein n=1 Tax=Kribbella sp. NPDC051718 TaxID=3155168 RepID=UPI00343C3C2B
MDLSAGALMAALRAHARPGEVVHKHYSGSGEVLGVPMRNTFDTAKVFSGMTFGEVERLLDQTSYESRLAGFCVLDFKARGKKTSEDERQAAYELYLRRHDAIDSWDMVDRAAPHVIGRHLLNRDRTPLFDLARTADPLRRRTAITAPLYFARYGTPADLTDLYALAELLLDDQNPVVSKPVGIALKYAGVLDQPSLRAFLRTHESAMQKPTLRYAREKLK